MSEIRAGDLVECIDVGPNEFGRAAHQLRKGSMYRVEGVTVSRPWKADAGALGFLLYGIRGPGGLGSFRAYRFRKIEAADDSFTASIRACKPAKQDAGR